MTPAPSVRRAGPADAAAVRALTRAAYARWVPVVGREPTPVTEDYDRIVREDLVDLLVAGDELLALAWMLVNPDHLLVKSLAVAPAHQGRGHGRRMLAHAEGSAVGLGLPVVRLYTKRLFVANVELYRRAGYAIDREEPFWGGVKVHLSKRVGPPPTAPPAPA